MIDTAKWWVGRHIIVRPQWVSRVEWSDHNVTLDVDRATVEASPEYDPTITLSRDYESRLHAYYKRDVYWDGE